jgi:hypothetical protein
MYDAPCDSFINGGGPVAYRLSLYCRSHRWRSTKTIQLRGTCDGVLYDGQLVLVLVRLLVSLVAAVASLLNSLFCVVITSIPDIACRCNTAGIAAVNY